LPPSPPTPPMQPPFPPTLSSPAPPIQIAVHSPPATPPLRPIPCSPPSPPLPPPPLVDSALHPPPTFPPNEPLITAVKVVLIAAGTVDDYDTSEQGAIASTLAASAGVSASDVAIDVVSASVRITATIDVPNVTQAAIAADRLTTALATIQGARNLLNMTIEAVPNVTYNAFNFQVGTWTRGYKCQAGSEVAIGRNASNADSCATLCMVYALEHFPADANFCCGHRYLKAEHTCRIALTTTLVSEGLWQAVLGTPIAPSAPPLLPSPASPPASPSPRMATNGEADGEDHDFQVGTWAHGYHCAPGNQPTIFRNVSDEDACAALCTAHAQEHFAPSAKFFCGYRYGRAPNTCVVALTKSLVNENNWQVALGTPKEATCSSGRVTLSWSAIRPAFAGSTDAKCSGHFDAFAFNPDGTRVYMHSRAQTLSSNAPCRFIWREQSPPFSWRVGANYQQDREGYQVCSSSKQCDPQEALVLASGVTAEKCADLCRSKQACTHFSLSADGQCQACTHNTTIAGGGVDLYSLGTGKLSVLRSAQSAACVQSVTAWLELTMIDAGGVRIQSETAANASVNDPADDAKSVGRCNSSNPPGRIPDSVCSRSTPVTTPWIDFNEEDSSYIFCGICPSGGAQSAPLPPPPPSSPPSAPIPPPASGAGSGHEIIVSTNYGATSLCKLKLSSPGVYESNCPIYYVRQAQL